MAIAPRRSHSGTFAVPSQKCAGLAADFDSRPACGVLKVSEGGRDAVIGNGTTTWIKMGRLVASLAWAPLGCAAHTESQPRAQVTPARRAKFNQSTLPQTTQNYVPRGAPGAGEPSVSVRGREGHQL